MLHYSGRYTELERRERLLRIQNSVHHLTHLIDDVVYVGDAEMQEARFSPTDANFVKLCEDIARDVELAYGDNQRIILTIEGTPRTVQIDHALIHKILLNLLTNALKYSDDAVNMTVTFHPEVLTLHVRDRGIGIPEDDLANLFDTFHRAKNVKGIPGTGLGLAIVQQAIQTHGGDVRVESVVDEGTTFTVTLPV